MLPPELLIFDLDGTLIDSSKDLCLSVNAMLADLGRAALPPRQIASYIGNGAAALVERSLNSVERHASNRVQAAKGSHRTVKADFDHALFFFIRHYREHKLDHTCLYPGVRVALEAMRAATPSPLMAVLTNKPVGPSREICEGLGVAEFFFQNYGGDSFSTKKPNAEGLTALIAEANATRRSQHADAASLSLCRVMMIGDSAVDVETARRGGTGSLGCLYGLAPESLRSSSPNLLVQHASEWPSALGFIKSATAETGSSRKVSV